MACRICDGDGCINCERNPDNICTKCGDPDCSDKYCGMEFEDCSPTLAGYKRILEMFESIHDPTENQKESMRQIKKYIKQQESKGRE